MSADPFAGTRRSEIMRRVKAKNTTPEMIVRRLIHGMGFRYRLHKADLPGKPDLVFTSRKKVIFVHGCFWHRHDCSRGQRTPTKNRDYWEAKLARNAERDREHQQTLKDAGWQVLTVWECDIRDLPELGARLTAFLSP